MRETERNRLYVQIFQIFHVGYIFLIFHVGYSLMGQWSVIETTVQVIQFKPVNRSAQLLFQSKGVKNLPTVK